MTKRVSAVVVALLLLAPSSLSAQQGAWSVQSELDLFLSVKAGAGYEFTDALGIKGTLGVCLISPTQISWTLVGVGHFMDPDSGLQIDMEAGIVQSIFDVLGQYVYPQESTQNVYVYLVPGACVSIGYRWPSGHQVSLRGGAGVLLGYDLGTWQGPSFQPNIALEYSWRSMPARSR
ncbi:MAG TPA: hypothetical protein VHE79_12820 [Spirochaetia bacterium]